MSILQPPLDNSHRDDDEDNDDDLSGGGHDDLPATAPLGERRARPFRPEGEKLFSQDNVTIYVKDVKHLKKTKNELEDHYYNLVVKPENKDNIKLASLYNVLKKAVIEVLKNLQKVYYRSKDNMVAITIHGEKIDSSINQDKFSLFEDPVIIADNFFGKLGRFFSSEKNRDILLDKTFRLNIAVASSNHVRELRKKPKYQSYVPIN